MVSLRRPRRGPLHRRLPARLGLGGDRHPGADLDQARRALRDHRQLPRDRRLDGREPRRHGDRLPRRAAGRAEDVARDQQPVPSAVQRRRRHRPAHVEQGGARKRRRRIASAVTAACRRTTCCTSSRSCKRGDMLPAIYFIFSRRGCREALQRCSYHELDLTTAEEKEAIDRVAAERLQALTDHDEETLFRSAWSTRASCAAAWPSTTPDCSRTTRRWSRSCSSAA